MVFKNLGSSDLKISAIGLGTGSGFDKKRDVELIRLVRTAAELGINFFDTAEAYFGGRSEEILGRAFKKSRSKVVIASKFSPEHSKRRNLIRALDGSLKRIKSDYLDLYQVHWPSLSIPIEETISTLETQVKKGKIRYIGVSNFSKRRLLSSLGSLKYFPLSSVQNEYNFQERGAESEVLPICAEKNITFIAYNPLASGFGLNDKKQNQLFKKLVKKYSKTNSQIVLSWLISKPNVVAIPGTTSFEHLKENAKSANFSMQKLDLGQFDEIFKQKVDLVPISKIEVYDDDKTYLSIEEAVENKLMLVPSPKELSIEIKAGDFLKPIKLKTLHNRREKYLLEGGKIRFWAWVIAYGNKKPIPAVID